MDNTNHPLLGRFDLDPGRWRPYFYGVEIEVGVSDGAIGRGSINLNNQPFILTRLAHQIIGATADPSVSGLYQDGQYSLAWKDDQSVYQKQPVMANCLCGSIESGFSYELPYPLPYAGSKTLTFEIQNRVTRVIAGQRESFIVAVYLHGIADWGTLAANRQ